ncbi:uncharacterized protein LOC122053720 [Zingiber officinale]|uniref:Epidermal patterning factor-like protein n=1 Tax=Zingiber officinale TaxID=94328 RepID=A0A8J5H5Z2_ZINOF|nr:uncharacterized protein LOC122053720 [Zingiber officinale]KAG6521004.1 hypothetical protein ZIOFF_018069 [Zingiber officinale]
MDLRGTSRGGRGTLRFDLKLAVVCSIFLGIGSVLFLVAIGSSSTGTGACLEIIRSWREKVEALSFSAPVLKLHGNQRRREVATGRRELAEAGSRPPICAYKCGRCSPCSPVHVQVPPSTAEGDGKRDRDAAEYLPVAWWCRCHGRLYQP